MEFMILNICYFIKVTKFVDQMVLHGTVIESPLQEINV